MGRGQVSLFCSTRGVCEGLWFCIGSREGPASHGRKLILLCLYVTFFPPVLDCVVCFYGSSNTKLWWAEVFGLLLLVIGIWSHLLDRSSLHCQSTQVSAELTPVHMSKAPSVCPRSPICVCNSRAPRSHFAVLKPCWGQENSARLCKTPFASTLPHGRFFSWILLLPGFSIGSVLWSCILWP